MKFEKRKYKEEKDIENKKKSFLNLQVYFLK